MKSFIRIFVIFFYLYLLYLICFWTKQKTVLWHRAFALLDTVV